MTAELDSTNRSFWAFGCSTWGMQAHSEDFDEWYLGSYPWLFDYLPPLSGNDRVLEVGPGQGALARYLVPRCDLSVIDLVKREVGARSYVGSVLDLPFGRDDFEHVIAIGVLHHTGNPTLAFRELARVARKTITIMVYATGAVVSDEDPDGNPPPFTSFHDEEELEQWGADARFLVQRMGRHNLRKTDLYARYVAAEH